MANKEKFDKLVKDLDKEFGVDIKSAIRYDLAIEKLSDSKMLDLISKVVSVLKLEQVTNGVNVHFEELSGTMKLLIQDIDNPSKYSFVHDIDNKPLSFATKSEAISKIKEICDKTRIYKPCDFCIVIEVD